MSKRKLVPKLSISNESKESGTGRGLEEEEEEDVDGEWVGIRRTQPYLMHN